MDPWNLIAVVPNGPPMPAPSGVPIPGACRGIGSPAQPFQGVPLYARPVGSGAAVVNPAKPANWPPAPPAPSVIFLVPCCATDVFVPRAWDQKVASDEHAPSSSIHPRPYTDLPAPPKPSLRLHRPIFLATLVPTCMRTRRSTSDPQIDKYLSLPCALRLATPCPQVESPLPRLPSHPATMRLVL